MVESHLFVQGGPEYINPKNKKKHQTIGSTICVKVSRAKNS
jgi:hypothetical protein